MRVLVTGSNGFLGKRVCDRLEQVGLTPIEFDLPEYDILRSIPPQADAAIHLATDKYAVHGEEHPARVADVNIRGTERLVSHIPRVVLASTCKAASPATCYGASKLIAERIVLNAGGNVLRLVNVLGSAGSVVEQWNELPADAPIPVTDCERYWMTPEAAVSALVGLLGMPPGRYVSREIEQMHVMTLARRLFPDREQERIPYRLGDRPVERLCGEYEQLRVGSGGYSEILDLWQRQ